MPAGINQEIKLVYCVKEFQQKSFQHLTMCKILKSQFGFLSYQQDRTANPVHPAALFFPILKSDHLVTSLALATKYHIVINYFFAQSLANQNTIAARHMPEKRPNSLFFSFSQKVINGFLLFAYSPGPRLMRIH